MNLDLLFILGLIIVSFFVGIKIVGVYIEKRPERTIAYSCALTLIIGCVYALNIFSIRWGFILNSYINSQIFLKVLSYLSISVSVILVNILFSIIGEEKTISCEHNHSTIETLKVILVSFLCLTSLIFAFPEGNYALYVVPIFGIGFVSIVLYVLFKLTKLHFVFEGLIFLTSHNHSESLKNENQQKEKLEVLD